ncbi:MAG TPA: citramalate synthase [Humisphaera sp.]|jgi:2-isopropylmalate synthase|nr:citramalate synthase [Humisphaera sp.]
MSQTRRIEIYDTTLRDGTQGEGFNLSLQDKLMIAQKLDELGVDYIEGGFPGSNEKDRAFFQDIKEMCLKTAKISAFGMTRRRGVKAEDDPNMKLLLDAQTPVVTLVGKTSDYQARAVLNVTPEENLAMIGDSVKLMRSAGRQVVYDAEHFFDTFASNREYALQTLLAAQEAGASVLCLCDTNGGSMPERVAEAVETVKRQTGVKIGIHTHNDSAVAVANALAAVNAGADHAQGTINGVGERCGNMDLIALIANLRLKYKLDCLQRADSLERLTEVSRYVYETANLNLVPGQPFVGSSAFAHKGGMHVQAIAKDVSTYEHVPPESVGNNRKILISELSGVSNIATKAGQKFDLTNDKAALRAVLERVKTMENVGYQFEAAEASFELLVRKEIGRYRSFFELDHYRVTVIKQAKSEAVSEATIKLSVGDKIEHCVAEGDGPVNALDGAIRRALKPHYAAIERVHLIDYKVRVINSKDETAASVRVVIECRRTGPDGAKEVFGTIGVSQNIIDASWQALVDAYEYHLLHETAES